MVSIREDGRIEFKFYRPNASDVRVAGDFDKWAGRTPMRNAGKGWWILDAELPPGEYRFCYRADGQQYADYAAFGVEATGKGWNSVLIVPEVEVGAEEYGDTTVQETEVTRIAA